ncbi:MAG: zinc-ribbon domain-containing protein [Clostridia bacterium]|nr:zinc-ribbon domain-containing protein [Clostridia bacterium]
MDMYSSLAIHSPDIAKEWDYVKNSPLRPDQIGHGSTKKVFWICKKGHSFEARIDHRTIMHSGCPYCSGKRLLKGQNDLLTLYPEVAAEWDYERNDKSPDDYFSKSNQVVFWKCPYCGYSYKKDIASRVLQMTGCPNCRKEKGTSFQEQNILYYLSLKLKTDNRYKLFGKEIDVFLPGLNTGIEYDGKYFHDKKREKDFEKHCFLRDKGIRLIVIEEGPDNAINGDEIVVRSNGSGHVANEDLEWAIHKLFAVLNIDAPDIDLSRDHIAIKEQYIISRKTDNFAAKYPEIAKEWDPIKNGSLRPENFSPKSNHKAYFDCPVCGTVYLRKISDRAIGIKCPVCAGKKVKKGYNDLATTDPDLMSEWHERNTLNPNEIPRGTDRKAWWRCNVCHYEWQATISSRTTGNVGCPVCAGKVVVPGYNDLETLFPSVAAEFDKDKNNGAAPSQIRPGSNRKYWWKCGKCGNEWEATVSSRTSGCGCPKCGRKLAKKARYNYILQARGTLSNRFPDIAAEWDYAKNGDLSPDTETAGSDKKIWWKCRVCNNSWQATISSRTSNGNGCPECGKKKCVVSFQKRRIAEKGSLAELRPDLAAQWDYEANAPLTPHDVTVGSNKKAAWICSKGHKWNAIIYARSECGCPFCSGKKAVAGETDFGTIYPDLLKEWNWEDNTGIDPGNYTFGSHKKVSWKCSKCGYVWNAEIKTRTSGCGCPRCAGKIKETIN